MTATPFESMPDEAKDVIAMPELLIDPNADQSIANQLQADKAWLLKVPFFRLHNLEQFAEDPGRDKAGHWTRLIDRNISRQYEFDEATEDAITQHPLYTTAFAMFRRSSAGEQSERNGRAVRIARVAIYLERVLEHRRAIRALGSASLGETE